ncbi:hypothetical protein NDU88_001813 [Pleurodeles waltl]|uniref:Core shell protein Gag P30 domain-containing protein n=1 Tax=Pleurodeles waltl TaxID=8319 RepID=A0AAV7QAY1_PLEWA|nr:hypothetical protein NDU88_001813 [Pleurodeles waltl]
MEGARKKEGVLKKPSTNIKNETRRLAFTPESPPTECWRFMHSGAEENSVGKWVTEQEDGWVDKRATWEKGEGPLRQSRAHTIPQIIEQKGLDDTVSTHSSLDEEDMGLEKSYKGSEGALDDVTEHVKRMSLLEDHNKEQSQYACEGDENSKTRQTLQKKPRELQRLVFDGAHARPYEREGTFDMAGKMTLRKDMARAFPVCPGNNLTPKEIVAQYENSWYNVVPFTDNLAGWTEGLASQMTPWPREGSFEPRDMANAEMCIFQGAGDPYWDYPYMQKSLRVWQRYACKYDSRHSTGNRTTVLSQLPLIFKGPGAPQYIPWPQMDKENLKKQLPQLAEGAGKWIAALEKHTAGITLAIGDIKSLLSSLIGDETDTPFTKAGVKDVTLTNPKCDGAPFNRVRGIVWKQLRKMYPDRPDIGSLMAQTMQPNEDPAQFLSRMKEKWTQEVGESWDVTGQNAILFFNIVKKGLPVEVQDKLDNIVALEAKPWTEIQAHIIHFCKKRQEKEKSEKDKIEKAAAKLVQQKLAKKTEEGIATATTQLAAVSLGMPPSGIPMQPYQYAQRSNNRNNGRGG